MSFGDGFWWGVGASDVAERGAAPAGDRRTARPVPAEPAPDPVDPVALLGVGHRRVTVEWARLEPEPGRLDDAEVEDLRRRLADQRAAGTRTWACLHDGSLPGWFSIDERGFADDRSWRYFWARHVEQVGELLGDLVDGWVPTFEPTRWARRGWLTGEAPPGRRGDAEGFTGALVGILDATVDAATRLRGGGRPVATAIDLAPVTARRPDPATPPGPDAEAQAAALERVVWGSWARLLADGVLDVAGRAALERPAAREAFDVIGFTYRSGLAVDAEGAIWPYPDPPADRPRTGWAEGFGLVLHRLAEVAGDRPLLAAGIGLDTTDEEARARYLRDVLAIAAEAVADGIDLRGLWWTTPVDPRGATGRPGLISASGDLRPAGGLWREVVAGGPLPGAGDA